MNTRYLNHLILLAAFLLLSTSAKSITWTADTISYRESFSKSNTLEWKYRLQINSTGPIYSESNGHFRLKFSLTYAGNNQLHGLTECVDINANAVDLNNVLNQVILGSDPLVIGDDTPFGHFLQITPTKYSDSHNSTIQTENTFDLVVHAVRNISHLTVTHSTSNCSSAHTFGSWHDSTHWTPQTIPGSNDTVIIPSNAGYIQLMEHVSVKGLQMYGGTILAMTTRCPDGWTLDDRGLST